VHVVAPIRIIAIEEHVDVVEEAMKLTQIEPMTEKALTTTEVLL
jgi:hypothetical protein